MLGDFQSTSTKGGSEALDWRPKRTFVAALASSLLGSFLATFAVPSPVAPPTVLAPGPLAAGPAETAHARVSTSPDESTPTATPPMPSPLAGGVGEAENANPLTRAAARRRVESISPVPWLARFGPVSLERRE